MDTRSFCAMDNVDTKRSFFMLSFCHIFSTKLNYFIKREFLNVCLLLHVNKQCKKAGVLPYVCKYVNVCDKTMQFMLR